MTTFISLLRVEPATGADARQRVRVVLERRASEVDDHAEHVQRDVRATDDELSFTVDSNGLELMAYDALDRAAELLEKREDARAQQRAAKIRAFMRDVQST